MVCVKRQPPNGAVSQHYFKRDINRQPAAWLVEDLLAATEAGAATTTPRVAVAEEEAVATSHEEELSRWVLTKT
jgi:hypothetical protein